MAVICIGEELLDGRIRDKNARHLVDLTSRLPVTIAEIQIIGDDISRIVEALQSTAGIDVVVISGGLGPTSDDLTRDAAARFSNSALEQDDHILSQLRERFESRGYTFTENNYRQCNFPAVSTILPTEVGTAAGFRIDRDETSYFFFPGVPSEFRWFVDRYIPLPGDDEVALYTKKMTFFGISESRLETRIKDATEEARRLDVRVGYRANRSLIELSLKGDRSACETLESMIRSEIGPWLVAEDDESFPERLGRLLVATSATVSVAESCTSGLLAARLTEVSGSSRYFEEGYLTYANSAKERLLSVDPEMLENFGAVSPQVAAQMAAGARQRAEATFAMAISGIAGPTGGTPDKPVGTVDFALATPEGVYHRRSTFPGRSREEVRALSVHVACALLLWRLENRLQEHNVDGPFSLDQVQRGIQALPSGKR